MFKVGDRVSLAVEKPALGGGERLFGTEGVVVEIEYNSPLLTMKRLPDQPVYIVQWDKEMYAGKWRGIAADFTVPSPYVQMPIRKKK